MIEKCKNEMSFPNMRFEHADVEQLPYENASFDWIISHMMLYHTESKEKALWEIKRTLKNQGLVGIITVSDNYMKRLFNIVPFEINMSASFSESIADKIIPQYFSNISKHYYEDILKITNIDAIKCYIDSSPSFKDIEKLQIEKFLKSVENEILSLGSYDIKKRLVMYLCQK